MRQTRVRAGRRGGGRGGGGEGVRNVQENEEGACDKQEFARGGNDTEVGVRLGHCTWGTYDVGKKLRGAWNRRLGGVNCDINLGSNLATHAYRVYKTGAEPYKGRWPMPTCLFPAETTKHYTIGGPYETPEDKKQIATYFTFHGLLPLFLSGTRIVLGTDGSGIEHSNHRSDFKIACAIIDSFIEFVRAKKDGAAKDIAKSTVPISV